ncbi:MAG: S8 family peptidase [Planctomycetota bacterium]
MRRLGHFVLFLAAACGGGDATSLVDAEAPTPFRTDRLLLSLEHPDDDEEIEELREDFAGLDLQRIGDTSFFVLVVPPGQDLDRLLRDLDDDLRVVSTERDYVGRAPEGGPSGSATLGSELIDQIALQRSLESLDLPSAHALARGAGVVVAVVDTGVDAGHPLLAGRISPLGYDFIENDADPSEERDGIDQDGDGLADDQYGHGTFIASLILTVAPDARVLPVRVLDDEGVGTASGVSAGIVWAVDQGAHIINVSVDMAVASEALKEAIDYAHNRGAVVVAAAGNSSAPDLIFPARLGDVTSVAAVDSTGVVAPFTNFDSDVDFVGPGVDMLGAVPLDLNPNGTAHWNGTSFAAPVVAGAFALVASAFPGEQHEKWLERLKETALPVDGLNPGRDGRLGSGLVQPVPALRR